MIRKMIALAGLSAFLFAAARPAISATGSTDVSSPSTDGTLKATPDAPLAQKPIVMPLNEVRLHLPHGVQEDAHDNQEARSAKKSGGHPRNTKPSDHGFRNHCDDREEKRAGKGQSSQRILEKFRSRFSGPISGNVSVVFL